MTFNTKAIEKDCANHRWSITVDFDEGRFRITGPSTSVSVTQTANYEPHLYAAGPFDEVMDIIRMLESHKEGRP